MVSTAFAVPDIQFSPSVTSPGVWAYDGTDTFSFSQNIDVDLIQGAATDALQGQFVYLPDLTLSNYVYNSTFDIGIADISPGGSVDIKNGSGVILLSGTLANGIFKADGATGTFYSDITLDLLVTLVNPSTSVFLGGVSPGDYFDFNLTLQGSIDLNDMIQDELEDSDGFSGSMTTIPEPATMALLALGGLLIRRRHK